MDHKAERYYAEHYLSHIEPHLGRLGPTPLRILDVGCGTGRFLLPLAALGHHLLGIDHHRDSIRRIREKAAAFGGRVEICDSSAENVLAGLPAGSFDAALALEVLYTHRDHMGIIRSIHRLVRPGGVLFITHRPPSFYLHQALQNGDLDDAILVQSGSEGRLRKGNHRIFNNWQTVDEIGAMYAELGATILALVPIGPHSGFSSDPQAKTCDPGQLSDDAISRLRELESRAGPETLASSRYNLVISAKLTVLLVIEYFANLAPFVQYG